MIWYLLKDFKYREKEKMNFITLLGIKFWVRHIAVFVLICSLNILAVHKTNFVMSAVGYIILITYAIYFVKNTELVMEIKFGNALGRYKKRLSVLRNVLKDMDLYSDSKIHYIIELVDKQKNQLQYSKNIFKPFTIVMSTILIPLILGTLNWIYKYMKNIDEIVFYTGLIIALILALLSIAYMVKPIIADFIDKEYYSFNSLQSMLHDIYLMDFVE
ncbi:MAG: hypothetical protein JL50_00870 [Peptococcaceae bacterium BICA1-7]|nr:MAG: hypothetical protein JL50_00870 [Peptococcaceae bacterium BICA1-7]HBV98058.1 hypothetical protein [Desulfotomaculum sp.]